ncbi:hypothetical protein ALC53_08285 [Atta colombica]|uniref:Uncharacterized protein n=1 Tax=Atta colombica TaxID=520822 RepID=A0A195BAK1_9HYME|nr:hypothetical protein ALC53_08285 [Atta colombica]
MHVTTGEVMTSVECRQAIGQKLADVMGLTTGCDKRQRGQHTFQQGGYITK